MFLGKRTKSRISKPDDISAGWELVNALIIETCARVDVADAYRVVVAIGIAIIKSNVQFIFTGRGCSRESAVAGPIRAGQVTMRPQKTRARGSPISLTRKKIMKVKNV